MTNRQLKNIRYVKCPRCTRILPEPEQASLYTCGGCDTVLQAKNYTGPREALLTTRTGDVQSNGNSHDCEVGNSSGSSQRSSSGEQSSNQNEEIDRNTVDDSNFEQIGAENCAHHTSSSEESTVRKTEGGKQIIGQSNGNDHAFEAGESSGSCHRSSSSGEESEEKAVSDSNSEQIRSESCANHTVLSKQSGVLESRGGGEPIVSQGESGEGVEKKANSSSGVSPYKDHTIAGDKDSGKLSTEIQAREDGTDQDQYDGVAAENQNDEYIRNDNDTCETSTRREFEVLENRKSQHPVKEASTSIQSQPTETATQIGQEDSTDTVPGDEITSLVANRPVSVPILGKEDDSGKQQMNCIEHIGEKLPSVTNSSDIPMPTEATQNGNENSLPGAEGAHGNQSASDISSGSERSAPGVPQDPAVKETLRTKIEDIDDPVFHDSGQNRSTDEPETSELVDTHTHEKVGNLLKEVPRSPTKSSFAYDDGRPETSEPVNTHGKFGNALKEIQQSPTKRSFAYDGSVSSWDGNDDQVTEQPNLDEGVFSENDAVAGYDVSKESRRKYSNWRTQGQVKGSSSQVLDEKLKSRMVEEEESVRENDIPRHTRTRHDYCRDGLFPPKIPINRRSSELAFETGSSSSYVLDEPSSHRTRNHLYRYEDQEPWRRQTNEKRGYIDGRRFPEAALRQNDFLPMYNDDLSGEIYHKPRYNGYRDRRRKAESWSLSANLPQTRHSGGVYNGRYQIDEHYMQRHPDGRGWSAQLPSGPTRVTPAAYYRQGPMPYMDPLRETSWEPYDTYPSNYRRFLDVQSYAWANGTGSLSDDQRHTDWIRKRSYIRERRQAVKRHVRPKAGGAPFITCHFCFTVLQLPEEFLLSKRRKTHWLKCGACSKVLEYSLANESCLAPRLPYTGEGTESNLDRDVRSASHASLPRQSLFVSEEAHRHGKELLQYNSSKALGREKSKLKSGNSRNGERLDDSDDTAESSDQSKQVKVTWQLPARSKSPLHRLMGYSSVQDLLTARGASDVEM